MTFINKIPLAIKFLFDKEVPFRKKIWIILGLIYLISPIDIIPEPVLLLGIIDDITLMTLILSKLSSDLDKYIVEKEEKKNVKDIKGKIIENVEYDIEDDEK